MPSSSTPAKRVRVSRKDQEQRSRRGGPTVPRSLREYLDSLNRIDELFLDNSTVEKAFRLETYRSTGAISSTVSQQLRCYFVARCVFPPSGPVKNAEGVTDIRSVSDAAFLEKVSEHTIEIYQDVMNEVERRSGPVIEMYEVEESRERRVVIGFK